MPDCHIGNWQSGTGLVAGLVDQPKQAAATGHTHAGDGQPHTNGRARSCESCHLSEEALGYGIGGGRLNRPWDKPVVVDLMTADGQVLPQSARTQIEPVPGLEADWSRFVTEDGKQLQTVGHHFSGSRPLNDKERANTDRQGLCLACHQEIPTESLAVSLLHHVAKHADALPKTSEQHAGLIHKTLLFSAWGQAGGTVATTLVALAVVGWLTIRWRRKKAAGSAQAPTDPERPGSRDKHDA